VDGFDDASDIWGYTPTLTTKPLNERMVTMAEPYFCNPGQKAPTIQPKSTHHHFPSEDRLFCQLVDTLNNCAEQHNCLTCPKKRNCDYQFSQWVNRSTIHHLTETEYKKFKKDFERIQPK